MSGGDLHILQSYIDSGKLELALEEAQKLLSRDPKNAQVQPIQSPYIQYNYMAAVILGKLGNNTAAMKHLNLAWSHKPQDKELIRLFQSLAKMTLDGFDYKVVLPTSWIAHYGSATKRPFIKDMFSLNVRNFWQTEIEFFRNSLVRLALRPNSDTAGLLTRTW